VLGSSAVLAQANPQRMTDTAPPPAEERSSVGAIVMADSMVIAQRRHVEQVAEARIQPARIGKETLRATFRAQTRSDLEDLSTAQAIEFHQRGAAALTAR
jgi:hypothetical protein